MYKVIKGKHGSRYTKDNRLIKTADVPPEVIELLKDRPVVDDPGPPIDKKCIFCGARGNFGRFINLQTISLCEEHYQNESTGKIVQKLRQLKEAEDAQNETTGEGDSESVGTVGDDGELQEDSESEGESGSDRGTAE